MDERLPVAKKAIIDFQSPMDVFPSVLCVHKS